MIFVGYWQPTAGLASKGGAMRYEVKDDPHADPLLMLLPLQGKISGAVADDLNRSCHGKTCAVCGKPFNAARKQRGVGRVTHVDPVGGMVFTTPGFFCGAARAKSGATATACRPALME